MGFLKWTLVIVCTLLMIGTLGMMVSAVDWTDDVTDPAGDAEADGTADPSRTDVDILSVSITEDGDDINVTMVLAGEYNSSGTYTVSVEVDGDTSFTFSRYMIVGFNVIDDDFNSIAFDAYYSADGTMLSWVVAKTDIAAQNDVDIEYVMAMVMDLMGSEPTYTDYAGIIEASGVPMPDEFEILMFMPKINVLKMQASMKYKGENASNFRALMDEDEDGTVSAAEVQAFEDEMGDDEDTNASESNVTLDDMDPTTLVWDYAINGAKGPVDSTSSIEIMSSSTLTFPKPEDKDSHEIAFDEPFGDDMFGGDEPFGDELKIVFILRALDGWKFTDDSLPSKMKDYVNDDGDEVKIEGADLQNDWNNTFGKLTSFTIEESDESPGFGLTLAVGATLVLAVVAGRRRR